MQGLPGWAVVGSESSGFLYTALSFPEFERSECPLACHCVSILQSEHSAILPDLAAVQRAVEFVQPSSRGPRL